MRLVEIVWEDDAGACHRCCMPIAVQDCTTCRAVIAIADGDAEILRAARVRLDAARRWQAAAGDELRRADEAVAEAEAELAARAAAM